MGDAEPRPPTNEDHVSRFALLLSLISDADGVRQNAARVAKEGSVELRRILARNPHTPPNVLATLVDDSDEETRDAAARHLRLPFAAQQKVRTRESDLERHAEALRWITSIDEARPSDDGIAHASRLKKVLDECQDEYVLDFLATRAYAPASTLAHLALHADPLLREVVASNPNTSPKTLEELARDPYGGVRLVVADNPNTPMRALTLLLTDKSASVRAAASKRLGALSW